MLYGNSKSASAQDMNPIKYTLAYKAYLKEQYMFLRFDDIPLV